jgi:hypothetical protein
MHSLNAFNDRSQNVFNNVKAAFGKADKSSPKNPNDSWKSPDLSGQEHWGNPAMNSWNDAADSRKGN